MREGVSNGFDFENPLYMRLYIEFDCPRSTRRHVHALRNFVRIVTVIGLLAASLSASHAEEPARVFAAASLTNALNDVGAAVEAGGSPVAESRVRVVVRARQTDRFGRAGRHLRVGGSDVDGLSRRARPHRAGIARQPARQRTRADRAERTLGHGRDETRVRLRMRRSPASSAPANPAWCRWAFTRKQSLQNLGWWDSLQGRIVGTDDVRTALAFVERGECPLGIVYATDAKISDKVEVVARFPEVHAQADRLSVRAREGRPGRRSGVPRRS